VNIPVYVLPIAEKVIEMPVSGVKLLEEEGSHSSNPPSAGKATGVNLWSLLLWRYSRPPWTRSCAAGSGWPLLGRGLGWVIHRGPCQPLPFC